MQLEGCFYFGSEFFVFFFFFVPGGQFQEFLRQDASLERIRFVYASEQTKEIETILRFQFDKRKSIIFYQQ